VAPQVGKLFLQLDRKRVSSGRAWRPGVVGSPRRLSSPGRNWQ
jgi:hypothetical protein